MTCDYSVWIIRCTRLYVDLVDDESDYFLRIIKKKGMKKLKKKMDSKIDKLKKKRAKLLLFGMNVCKRMGATCVC